MSVLLERSRRGEPVAPPPWPAADPLSPSTRVLVGEVQRLRGENEELKRECGRLWLRAFSPKDRQKFLLDRFDRAAEILADAGRIDDHLDAAWELFCASLADVRKPVSAA